MPMFVLEPIDLEHPDWETSIHKDRCRVRAPDEIAAREFAGFAFEVLAEIEPGRVIPQAPWMNGERVKATTSNRTASETSDDSYPPLIEVPDYSKPQGSIDQWKSVDDIADLDAGILWKAYPDDEYKQFAIEFLQNSGHPVTKDGELKRPDRGENEKRGESDSDPESAARDQARGDESRWGAPWGTPWSREKTEASKESGATRLKIVVQDILANPEQYQFLARVLIRIVEDLDRGSLASPESNTHPIWGTLENATELDDLLRGIRDELRRFNDLLEQRQKDASGLAESADSLRFRIKDVLKAVGKSPFSKTVQVGFGGLVVAYAYQFGIKLGVPPLDPEVSAVVRQFLPGD